MKKYSTIASAIVLVPFLLFLVVLKGPSKSGMSAEIGYDKASATGNQMKSTESTQPKNTCRCDCDISTSRGSLEVTTAQFASYPKTSDYDLDDSETVSDSNPETKPPNPVIFVITPTYTRPTQMPDMTRLAQTLMLVKDVFWIVSEDATKINTQVSALLNRTGLPHVHLLGPRPNTHLDKRSGRGVSNRLKALEWLRKTYTNTTQQGVIYFADDDNSYDVRLFEEIRFTKKISVFPVGLLAKIGLSTPILDRTNNSIIGYHDPYFGRRKFVLDMAGFAVNLQVFLNRPKATMPYKLGYEEDYFIKSLGVPLQQFEPRANNCTEVLVWHTKTQKAVSPDFANIFNVKGKDYNSTNLPTLYHNMLDT